MTLGLIGKVNTYELNKENNLLFQHNYYGKQKLSREQNIPVSQLQEQNTYYIFPYTEETFKIAEERAKKMYENGFSMRSFSKIYVQRIFGLEFANTIFFNKIEESDFTRAVYEQIENIILTQLRKKHFTYKDEVLKFVKIDTEIYRHYEEVYPKVRFYNSRRIIAEFEYQRSVKIICNTHNIGYAMTNKKMKELFGLKNNKKILYDKAYVENAN